MIEGRVFQSIQHEVGSEAGIEEDVQGAVEVVVRDRLADYGNAFLRAGVEILGDLDGVGGDEFAVDRGFLGTERHTGVVEAGVGEGEDKAAPRFDNLAYAAHQRVDLGHVHYRHVADGSIEAQLPEGDDLLLAGGIEEAVFDAISMFGGARASAFEELCTEVSSDDVDPTLGHAAGAEPRAA